MVRISVELPDEVAEGLRQCADAMQSTPEHLMARAAEAMVADREALRQSIARGREDVAAGRVHDHDAVMAELDAWAEEVEARHRTRT